jgi:hypothetical protein
LHVEDTALIGNFTPPSLSKELRCNYQILSKVTRVALLLLSLLNENVNVITHNHYLQKRGTKSKILTPYILVF